jgi:hypothetical protein
MAIHPKNIESVQKYFLLGCFLLILFKDDLYAQKAIRFVPMYKNEPMAIPFHRSSDSLTITKCQWYITQLRVFDANSSAWVELSPCQLMNAEDPISMHLSMEEKIKPSRLSFLVGTDSLSNVSALFEGPLDPINGMYWAWNSGYINFKLEGTDARIASSDKRFEYHIGGYLPHQKTAQYVELDFPSLEHNERIEVGMNMDKLLEVWDVNRYPTIMLPGPDAVRFSAQLPNVFFVIVP